MLTQLLNVGRYEAAHRFSVGSNLSSFCNLESMADFERSLVVALHVENKRPSLASSCRAQTRHLRDAEPMCVRHCCRGPQAIGSLMVNQVRSQREDIP